jgi:Putative DNA-binding domain
MPTWSELQASFTRALLQDDAAVAGAVLGDGLVPEARLALYRHHVLTTLTEVLKAAYPVVCRLVDERFFAYAADCYIRQQPPAGPCLFEYGAAFPRFLAAFPPCCELVYLPDVAWLEWAIHAAWYAEDAVPLDRERLRGVAPDDLGCLTFTFDPSVSYVRSPWPIDRIWHANQPDADPSATVSLETGATYLEVRRLDDDVTWRSLALGAFACRAALAAHRSLGEAFEAALAADPDFDLTAALQALFAEGLVVDVIVSLEGKESNRW